MKELIDDLFSLVSKDELQKLLFIQLKNFFIISKEEFSVLNDIQPLVLNRLRDCIKGVDNKHFRLENKTFFSLSFWSIPDIPLLLFK